MILSHEAPLSYHLCIYLSIVHRFVCMCVYFIVPQSVLLLLTNVLLMVKALCLIRVFCVETLAGIS